MKLLSQILLLCLVAATAWAAPSSFVFEGVLTSSSGALVNSASQGIRIQIKNGATVHYSHDSLVAVTNGNFKVVIDNSVPADYQNGVSSLSQLLQLAGPLDLVVSVDNAGSWESFSNIALSSVPYAIDSNMVGGYDSQYLLKVGAVAATNVITAPQSSFLSDLLTYSASSAMTGCSPNSVLKLDGSSRWSCGTDATGGAPGDATYAAKGIVQFDTDLTTSGINLAAGIASLPAVGTAGTYGSALQVPVFTTDAKGRVSGVTNTTIAINPNQINQSAATIGQVLKWSGSAWAPAADNNSAPGDASYAAKGIIQFDTDLATSGISVTAGVASLPAVGTAATYGSAAQIPVITTDAKGRVSSVTSLAVAINANQITQSSAAVGQILKWNGSAWTVAADDSVDNTKLPLAGGTMSGAINMGANNIANAGNIELTSNRHLLLGQYSADPSTGGWGAAEKGRTWFNTTSNQMKYWDGATVQALGVSGAGLMSLGGQSGPTQIFAAGTAGNSPTISSGADVHTLNVPLASASGTVTSGTISNADYVAFNAKLGASTAFSGDISGTYSSTSVDKIKGTALSITGLNSENFLKYNGTNWVNTYLNINHVRSTIGPAANAFIPAGCTTGQQLVYSSITDQMLCTDMNFVAKRTTAAMNYYVRTDGNDSLCNGTADASAASQPNCATLTVAAALAKMPDVIEHAVTLTLPATVALSGANDVLVINKVIAPGGPGSLTINPGAVTTTVIGSPSKYGMIIGSSANNVIVRNLSFTNFTYDSSSIAISVSGSATLENCNTSSASNGIQISNSGKVEFLSTNTIISMYTGVDIFQGSATLKASSTLNVYSDNALPGSSEYIGVRLMAAATFKNSGNLRIQNPSSLPTSKANGLFIMAGSIYSQLAGEIGINSYGQSSNATAVVVRGGLLMIEGGNFIYGTTMSTSSPNNPESVLRCESGATCYFKNSYSWTGIGSVGSALFDVSGGELILENQSGSFFISSSAIMPYAFRVTDGGRVHTEGLLQVDLTGTHYSTITIDKNSSFRSASLTVNCINSNSYPLQINSNSSFTFSSAIDFSASCSSSLREEIVAVENNSLFQYNGSGAVTALRFRATTRPPFVAREGSKVDFSSMNFISALMLPNTGSSSQYAAKVYSGSQFLTPNGPASGWPTEISSPHRPVVDDTSHYIRGQQNHPAPRRPASSTFTLTVNAGAGWSGSVLSTTQALNVAPFSTTGYSVKDKIKCSPSASFAIANNVSYSEYLFDSGSVLSAQIELTCIGGSCAAITSQTFNCQILKGQ